MSAMVIIFLLGVILLTGFLITSLINAVKEHGRNRPYRELHRFSQRAQSDIDKVTKEFIDKMK